MEEILVKKYRASDGEIFNTADECLKHEKKLDIVMRVEEFIPYIKEICYEHYCENCPFYNGEKCRLGYRENIEDDKMPCDW